MTIGREILWLNDKEKVLREIMKMHGTRLKRKHCTLIMYRLNVAERTGGMIVASEM